VNCILKISRILWFILNKQGGKVSFFTSRWTRYRSHRSLSAIEFLSDSVNVFLHITHIAGNRQMLYYILINDILQ